MDRRHLRWTIPAAGVVLAAVVTIVLVVQDTGNAACAAPAGRRTGSASYYSTDRNGMCNLGAPSTDAYVAIGPAEYAGGAACGTYLDVTGPTGTTRVQVVDECPSCPAGKLDLSKAAFARVGSLGAGIIPISYAPARDPQLSGPLRVKAKGGTGYSSLSVVLDNHGNPLSTVELQTGAGWTLLQHGSDNTWTGPSGLTGPISLRITDVYGHQATLAGVALGSSAFQQTQVNLYAPASESSPSPSTSPSVSPSVSPSASQPPSASPAVPAATSVSASGPAC